VHLSTRAEDLEEVRRNPGLSLDVRGLAANRVETIAARIRVPFALLLCSCFYVRAKLGEKYGERKGHGRSYGRQWVKAAQNVESLTRRAIGFAFSPTTFLQHSGD
jgi:hypothetical protein